MSRYSLEYMIEVMTTAKKGKTIQYKTSTGMWKDANYPENLSWNWNTNDYRIKHEPKEYWICPATGEIIDVKTELEGFVRVREVIDNE